MNAMKKVIMLLIGAALVLSFAGAVAAAESETDHGVDVILQGNTGDYDFSLPASLTVNYDGSVNSDANYTLQVKDEAFGDNIGGDKRNYSISISSDKLDDNNNWTLVNEDDQNEAVVYGIYMNEDISDEYDSPEYNSGYSWWNKNATYFSERTEGISGYIFTQRLGEEQISSVFAKFTGTLTFTVTVNSAY